MWRKHTPTAQYMLRKHKIARVTHHFGVSLDKGIRDPNVQQLFDQLGLCGQPDIVELDQPAQQHHGLVLQFRFVDHWGHTHHGLGLWREGETLQQHQTGNITLERYKRYS